MLSQTIYQFLRIKLSLIQVVLSKVLDSPRLKSAVQSGRSTKPSPGLEGEIGGEKDTVLLLQSKS